MQLDSAKRTMQLDSANRTIFHKFTHPCREITSHDVRNMFVDANRSGRLKTPGAEDIDGMCNYLNQLIGSTSVFIDVPHKDAEASVRKARNDLSDLMEHEAARRCQSADHAAYIEHISRAIDALNILSDDWRTMPNLRRPSWHTQAAMICNRAQAAWEGAGRRPRGREISTSIRRYSHSSHLH